MGPRGGAWFVFLPGLGNRHRIQLQSRVISLARTSFGMFIAILRGRLSGICQTIFDGIERFVFHARTST